MGFPEGQAGRGAAVLLAEDLGDGGVVVAGCQAADQVEGVFAGDAAVVAAGGDRHLRSGAGAALPDDLDLARPGGVILAAVVLHGDGDLGDDRADEFLALGVGGGRGVEDGPQVGSGGGDPGGFLLGEGDGPAGLLGGELVFGGAHGRELVFQDGLQGPGDQPVLRFDVVVLAVRPAGFETGPFQCAFEHGQVLAEPGFGVGHGLDGGGQAGGGERGQQFGQYRLVQPPASDSLAGPRAVHLVRASAPVGGAAAGVVVDLHEPSAPAAAQQALQPGRAFPRGAAGPAAGGGELAASLAMLAS